MNVTARKLAAYGSIFVILTSAGGLAWASDVTGLISFTANTPAKAAEVNGNFSAVKTAVDDNNARIGAIEGQNLDTRVTTLEGTVNNPTSALNTDINNLKGNLTGGTCVTNNPSDEMVRVGPLCVDKNPASLWNSTAAGATAITTMPTGCTVEGTGCTGADLIVAQSQAAPGSALKDNTAITYAQAAVACANAGKRLLTPGEWMTAAAVGTANGMATIDRMEFVDGFIPSAGDSAPMQAGYIGRRTATGGQLQFASNAALAYNATLPGPVPPAGTWLGFRCAR